MSSREEILRRIRAATADIASPPDIPRRYQRADTARRTDDGLADRFAERAGDYRATVRRCPAADAARVIAEAVTAQRLVDATINHQAG